MDVRTILLIIHIITGSLVLCSGLLIIVNKYNAFTKAVYLISSLSATLSALIIAQSVSEGFFAQVGFFTLAIIWLVFLVVVSRDFNVRITRTNPWFIRTYALSLTVITLRMWNALFILANISPKMSYSTGLWLGWTINLLIAEYIILPRIKG